MTLTHSPHIASLAVSTVSEQEHAILAPVSVDPLWQPLDEEVYAWANFSTFTMHNSALIASGTALLALSWEQTALHHYTQARQRLQEMDPDSSLRPIISLLDQTMHDLAQATDHWQRVIVWLDRLVHARTDPPEGETVETIHALYRQAEETQHRLWTLTGDIRQERQRVAHPDLECAVRSEGGTD